MHSMAALAVLALALSCAGTRKIALMPSSRIPAAEGVVETKRADKQNTEVALEVEHLAPPDKVASGTTVYVVWVKPLSPEAPPQNVGAVSVGEDRKASLKTKTPHESFDLLVTPEPNATMTFPSNEPVLKAKIAPKQ